MAKLQQFPWSCGAASVVNACRALGRRVAEGRVRSLAGSSEAEGTDEVGLIQAVRGLGLKATPHHSSDAATAWAFIRSNVQDGRPCLLCIDQWQHWVCVIGVMGDRVIVIDPANTKANMAENGTHSLSRRDLHKRWRCKDEQEPFYAITVGK